MTVMASTAAAKEHVEEIRRRKFSIGGEPNPLTEDLHQAVKNLSAELYAKDVHFLMELIQNAEDNEYPEGVDPSLAFVITSKDITNTGASATLLIFNNEKGFSRKNIDSICSVGRSTKKGLRKHGYIGEKGIGFKSVFLITAQPYIFSNGYQIRFNEKPCQACNVGYIVPEWVDGDPIQSAIQSVYGLATALPATTLVLPLKADKVEAVKDQLSSIHPEVLLFLYKIKRLSVRENNEDLKLNTVSAISISSEKNFVSLKSMDAESYMLYLSTGDTDDQVDCECGYYMWKQRFPVKQENKVDVRSEVDEWVITLAFPIGERLKRGANMPGIYSFLPTETATNFPFVIQADFLLASSRENILWDNRWNQGILDCVPVAFINAFTTLVKSTEDAPVSSLPNMFWFLPLNESAAHPKLNHIRDLIKAKLMNEAIIPCESYTVSKLFCKPNEVGRLKPAFRTILDKAKSQGVCLSSISSHGPYLLTSSFDKDDYNVILNFLEIKPINNHWYVRCIGASNLVMGLLEHDYLQLLVFIVEFWGSLFYNTDIKNTPIIKYVGLDGRVNLFEINVCRNKLLAMDSDHISISWLINWNTKFHNSTGQFFLPEVTQEAIRSCLKKETLKRWLKQEVKVNFISFREYANHLSGSIKADRNLAVTYAHFLYCSLQKNYLWTHDVQNLCNKMPIVDNYGLVTVRRDVVLVPAKGSKWVELIGPNPWRQYNFVELGECYTCSVSNFGITTSGEDLVAFLKTYVGCSDIPNLSPPNAAIPTLSSPLTKSNTFLLLRWLHNLRTSRAYYTFPERFISSIKKGNWLKISLSGRSGYMPPLESFMLESSIENILQNMSLLVDIPLVDVKFYGDEIRQFKVVLQEIGVKSENKDVCEFIGKRLMSLAAYSKLTRDNVMSILKFIQYLGANYLSSKDFIINSIRGGKWLRTSQGYMPPSESFMLESSIESILENLSLLVDIPLVDVKFYGDEIRQFKVVLQEIGVKFENKDVCEFIGKHLMSLAAYSKLTRDNVMSILKFIQYLGANSLSSKDFIDSIRGGKWLRTSQGYMTPHNSVLFSHDWNAASQISDIPFIDQDYYGKEFFSFKKELELLGVVVDFNENCYQLVSDNLKLFSLTSLSSDALLLILRCIQKLKSSDKLVQALKNIKCLKTNLGYRCPSECILLSPGSEWGCLLKVFTSLPVLDKEFYGNSIFSMSEELKKIGVMVNFEDATKEFTRTFEQHASSLSITKEKVFSFLKCYRYLKETNVQFPLELEKCMRNVKWLRTKLGDYRSPNECILFSGYWVHISPISLLPFIDDSDKFYGSKIHDFCMELKQLGVIIDFNDGAKFVASGLFLPQDCSRITPKSVYALLMVVKKLKEVKAEICANFFDKLFQTNWLKSYSGYKRPNECLLFSSDWDSFLKRSDGPFIDEKFYGSGIRFYKEELQVIGVITDVYKGCQLLASYLKSLSSFESINRIYQFFSKVEWKPAYQDNIKIWIPRGTDHGKWVDPQECVLFDRHNLFGDQLYVLEKYKYQTKTLGFFADFINVKVHPSVDDYCSLWKKWEGSGQISHTECCAFWEFVVETWNTRTEHVFKKNLLKLPVTDPTSDRVLLFDKCDVFIGDDLLLMDLFLKSSRPIFVWYPRLTMKSVTQTKLADIYTKLGVRTLSESAQKYTLDVDLVGLKLASPSELTVKKGLFKLIFEKLGDIYTKFGVRTWLESALNYTLGADLVGLKSANPRELVVKKGLLKLILGFLADHKLKLDAERRHEAVNRILAVECFETPEPMTVCYSLSFSTGDVINVESKRMIRWDKQDSKLYMQKMERACGHINVMEYASQFAEVIANGVLWENEELVPQLFELIRLGFLVDFDEEEVDFLMKSNNLQIFLEDQDYLSSTFPSY